MSPLKAVFLPDIFVMRKNNPPVSEERDSEGAPGINGVTIEDIPYHFYECWQEIRTTIFGGHYTPKPVLRVEIEKLDVSIHPLGIPIQTTILSHF